MAKLYLSNGSTFNLFQIDLVNINATLFPPTPHPHVKADITDFAHTHSISDITDTIIGKSVVQPLATFDFLSYDVPAGIYSFRGGDSTKKAPFTDGQILSLPYRIGAGGRYGAQMAFEDDRTDVRIRTYHNVNGWSEWNKFAMVSDIPTTYDWAKVNNRPNTVSGYNITDACTVDQVNIALAGKLGTGGKAADSFKLGGLPAVKYVLLEDLGKDYYTINAIDNTFAPISSVNKIINGTTPAGDSVMLNGKLASQYVLASTLYVDYATKNYVTNSFAPISSFDKIVNGTTQVGNTKKVAGKEVKYYTQSAFASITPATGVHYIVYEN